MKIKFNYVVLTFGLIFLDQISKFIIRENFKLYETRHITSFFALTYTTNTGILWGLLEGYNIVFIFIITLVLAILIFSYKSLVQEYGILGNIVFCLIVSGGIGNLIDRIFLGKVVDFINLQWNYKNIWPIFNFADSYVFIGVWSLIIKHFLKLFKKS